MWRAAKVCFLYIGTVIGAGFASGKEIALFFGDSSPLNVALAALFMAGTEALFLYAGKLAAMPDGTAVRIGIFLAALFSVAAMIAGCELALFDLTGVRSLGAVAAIAAGALVTGGTEKIKLANVLLIPMLFALLIMIYVKIGTPVYGGTFSWIKPLHYAGLDVLMGGVVISREGKNLDKRQILLACAMSALFLSGVLFMLQNIVLTDKIMSSMPVFAVADKIGLRVAAGILIVIAVFTTLVSSLDVLTESVRRAMLHHVVAAERSGRREKLLARFAAAVSAPGHRALAAFGCLAAVYPLSLFGFENIVGTTYPFVGLCGVVMAALTAFGLIKRARHALRARRSASASGPNARHA